MKTEQILLLRWKASIACFLPPPERRRSYAQKGLKGIQVQSGRRKEYWGAKERCAQPRGCRRSKLSLQRGADQLPCLGTMQHNTAWESLNDLGLELAQVREAEVRSCRPRVRSPRKPSRVWLPSHDCEWGQRTQRLMALSVSSSTPRTCGLNVLGRGRCNPIVGGQLPPPISAFWEVFFLLNPNPSNLLPPESFTWMGWTGWGALRWKYCLYLPSCIMLRPHSQQQQCKTAGSPKYAGTWRGHT